MITLWHPKIIKSIIQHTFTRNARNGESILLKRGPTINIPKIPAIERSPCVVLIPKSACLSTSTAKRTVTPTTLFSDPVSLLNNVTTATQNAMTR